MRVTCSRAYTRPTPTPKMPPGLVELMEGLSKDVLKNNPDDLYEFCAGHMQKLLEIRDDKPPRKQMSLEQKIKRAQEKLREKIRNRLLQQNEMTRQSNESQEKEKNKQGNIESTLESEIKMPLEGTELKNLPNKPVQREGELVETSQVEISHDPNETVKSNDICREPVKQHTSELITVKVEENTNNKNMTEAKESTADINAEFPIRPETVHIEKIKKEAKMEESNVDIQENVPNAPEINHPTELVEVKIDEKEKEVDVKAVIPESLPNPSSFDEIVGPTKDKIIEPTKDKMIEPIQDKMTEITNDNKSSANIEHAVESERVINESIAQHTESVLPPLNQDLPSDLIIDTSKPGESVVDNTNEMGSKVHNETLPSSEFKTVKAIKNTSIENAAVSVETSKETLDLGGVTHPQSANKPTQFDIDEHVIEPKHITAENMSHNTEDVSQSALIQDVPSDLKPEKPTVYNNFQVESTDDMEAFSSSESKTEKGTKTKSVRNESVPVQNPSETRYAQSNIPSESTLINKPTQINKDDFDLEKELISSENELIKENGTVHVDCQSRSNTKSNNYEGMDSKEIKKDEENHDESRLEQVLLKSNSDEVDSVSINNPEMSINTETQSHNETQDFKRSIIDNRVVPDIAKNLERSKSQDIFVDSGSIDMPSFNKKLIDTAHNFLDQEREFCSSVMEEKAVISKKVTLLGNEDNTTGEKAEPNEKTTVAGMDLETAAITIQKVFRSFLFSKSRTSTLDDAVNENSLDEDIDKKEAAEYAMSSVNLNKERRPLVISRIDTVLQTVNEEKSLSQSTDESSLSSAATTIQAHVRGFLVRSRLASYNTASNSSLINAGGPSTVSLDGDGSEHKKTILNIHIVPERGEFMSRDESLLTSIDLPLDSSPPSSINLHPLGYDKSEPRKQLKREDAIQSVSPPSNNSGKLSEEVDSVKDILNENNEQEQYISLTINDQRHEDAESCDTTLTFSSTADTVVDAETYNHRELMSSLEHNLDGGPKNKEATANLSSDEMDVVTPFPNADKTISSSDSEGKEKPKLVHSGEFHDMVVLTQVKRSESSVVREFKNVLVYFLIWDKT